MSIIEDEYLGNTAVRNGGALYFDLESLVLEDSSFELNKAQNGAGIYFLGIGKDNS